ncbi:MBL fold metallo-hydrolase [Polymorphobacter arshaanensis]|uniref:MBL fold metallo-hydrolase n=1 Tax=Glacieibacterium arshaanense TaxID=2511025 RepID=A0A4Y9EPD6_9SPHN|nr:MBL fold metallo-hydrolase [Polymorphobacter arshaanensis]TFU05487.1 MBL fold metallo-hydrolase [Polymorphobacter arshaanensis]
MDWNIGKVSVTTIFEQDLEGLVAIIPAAKRDAVRAIDWLAPDFADAEGNIDGVIQAFVIRAGGRLIVVDTCVGDDKDRRVLEAWHHAHTGFLDRFRAAGFDPAAVDIVLCTHLHLDHVGWNTFWTGTHWAPTFPNARYLFADVELAHWEAERATLATIDTDPNDHHLDFLRDQRQTHADSVQPIIDAGLADVVSTSHRICDEVRLEPTPGHTPGHVSVVIESDGALAVITGDSFHHPCQMAHPEWSTSVDADSALGITTRQAMLGRLAGTQGVLMGSHFAPPTAGRVVADGAGYRLVSDKA